MFSGIFLVCRFFSIECKGSRFPGASFFSYHGSTHSYKYFYYLSLKKTQISNIYAIFHLLNKHILHRTAECKSAESRGGCVPRCAPTRSVTIRSTLTLASFRKSRLEMRIHSAPSLTRLSCVEGVEIKDSRPCHTEKFN